MRQNEELGRMMEALEKDKQAFVAELQGRLEEERQRAADETQRRLAEELEQRDLLFKVTRLALLHFGQQLVTVFRSESFTSTLNGTFLMSC